MLSLSTVNDMGVLDLQASCSVQYLSAKNPNSLSLISVFRDTISELQIIKNGKLDLCLYNSQLIYT